MIDLLANPLNSQSAGSLQWHRLLEFISLLSSRSKMDRDRAQFFLVFIHQGKCILRTHHTQADRALLSPLPCFYKDARRGKRAFCLQILLKKQCFTLRLKCDKTAIRVTRNQVFPDEFLPVFHSVYISFQSACTKPVQTYIRSSSRWPILIQLLRSQQLYKYVLSCDASAPWHAPKALFSF